MKLMASMTLICAAALASGCVPQGDYCQIDRTLWMNSQNTADFLAANDPQFLRDLTAHNEVNAANCSMR